MRSLHGTAGRLSAARHRLWISLTGSRATGGRYAQRIAARVFCESSGSSLVEFALCSIVLITMMFGIIECCFAIYSYNYVSDATRSAARYAIVRGSSCVSMPDCGITAAQIQTYIQGIPYPGIQSSNISASVTWLSVSASQPTTWTTCANQCNAPGNAVQVHVTYTFPLSIPFWKSESLSLQSTSQMVISN